MGQATRTAQWICIHEPAMRAGIEASRKSGNGKQEDIGPAGIAVVVVTLAVCIFAVGVMAWVGFREWMGWN